MKMTARRGDPWISVPHIRRQPEPANLKALKGGSSPEGGGIIELLNLIKDAYDVTWFTAESTLVASGRSPTLRRCAAGCYWCCSGWAPTWASAGRRWRRLRQR